MDVNEFISEMCKYDTTEAQQDQTILEWSYKLPGNPNKGRSVATTTSKKSKGKKGKKGKK